MAEHMEPRQLAQPIGEVALSDLHRLRLEARADRVTGALFRDPLKLDEIDRLALACGWCGHAINGCEFWHGATACYCSNACRNEATRVPA